MKCVDTCLDSMIKISNKSIITLGFEEITETGITTNKAKTDLANDMIQICHSGIS